MAEHGRMLPFRGSINRSLVLLLIVVLLPILLAQASIYYNWFHVRYAEELQANLELARAVGSAFDASVNDILHQELIIGEAYASISPNVNGADHFLDVDAREYPDLRYRAWASPDGQILASSDAGTIGTNLGSSRFFAEITTDRRDWSISDLFLRPDGEASFVIARGIRDAAGELLGVVVVEIQPDRLGEVLAVTRTGNAAVGLVDRTGRLVFRHPSANLSWEQRDLLTHQRAAILPALMGQEWKGTFVSAIDGVLRMTGRVPIGSIGWVASASRPESDVMAPIRDSLFRDFAIGIAAAGLACLVAFGLGHSVATPMKRLREHAATLAAGNYNNVVDVAGPVEVRALANALNEMSKEILVRESLLIELNEKLRATTEQAITHATEADSARQDAEQQALRLEQIKQAIEEHVRMISHDLRTPLTVILGRAQLIAAHSDDVALVQKSATPLIAAGRRLNAMLRDLVAVARIETGGLNLSLEAINLGAFVTELKERLEGLEDGKRIHLALDGPLPPVLADSERLDRILTNLLSNALKYSSSESAIEVSLGSEDEFALVAVADRGEGIAPEELPHLFERYYRTRSGRSDRESLGLGLYITKGLVEAHGGRIWVHSVPGVGTTFYFTLPFATNRTTDHKTF